MIIISFSRQEFIPVGCVPSAAVAVTGGSGVSVCQGVCLPRPCLPGGVCPGGVCLREGVDLPPVNRMTDRQV